MDSKKINGFSIRAKKEDVDKLLAQGMSIEEAIMQLYKERKCELMSVSDKDIEKLKASGACIEEVAGISGIKNPDMDSSIDETLNSFSVDDSEKFKNDEVNSIAIIKLIRMFEALNKYITPEDANMLRECVKNFVIAYRHSKNMSMIELFSYYKNDSLSILKNELKNFEDSGDEPVMAAIHAILLSAFTLMAAVNTYCSRLQNCSDYVVARKNIDEMFVKMRKFLINKYGFKDEELPSDTCIPLSELNKLLATHSISIKDFVRDFVKTLD